MRYGKARQIIAEAIELLSEEMESYHSIEHKSKEHKKPSTNRMEEKPSTNRLEEPVKRVAKPSPKSPAKSPAVKFGKRKSLKRYLRGNRWALRQIARNKSSVSEAIDQLDELTDAELKTLKALEARHEARMAKQERTAYMSPTMRYHVERLRKLAKPAAKKRKGKK